MSNAIDDKELNAYLNDDTQFSQRYRKIEADAVPEELDRLVLTNANRDAHQNVAAITSGKPKRTLGYWMRAGAPVALAASFVLVVSIVIKSGVQPQRAQESGIQDSADTKLAAGSLAADAASDKLKKESSDRVVDTLAQPERSKAIIAERAILQEEAKPANARNQLSEALPPPAAAAPAIELPRTLEIVADAPAPMESALAASEKRRESAVVAKAVNIEARASGDFAGSSAPLQQSSETRREADPSAWLQYIRQLRTAGNKKAADLEWQRFVKAYPQYPVDTLDTARSRK